MIRLNNFLGIIFVLLFYFNYEICNYFYNYDTHSMEWIKLRAKIYEFMFLIACYIGYNLPNKWGKMIFSFGFVFVLGSFLDKVVFEQFNYNLSDIGSGICAVIVGIVVYNKQTQNEVDNR